MRVDKFLKVSRILKRRTVANQAADTGRVEVNGRPAKPGHKLKLGDTVSLTLGSKVITFKVLSLNEKASKAEADTLYELISEQPI